MGTEPTGGVTEADVPCDENRIAGVLGGLEIPNRFFSSAAKLSISPKSNCPDARSPTSPGAEAWYNGGPAPMTEACGSPLAETRRLGSCPGLR